MTSTGNTTRIGIALAILLAAPQAYAQAGSWYAGGSAGRSTAGIDDAGIRRGLAGQGLATATLSERDDSTGYKLYGGYGLTPHLAIEAGLFDLGRFGYSATTAPAGTLGGDIRVKGLAVDLVGRIPLAGKLSALGRVGAISAQTRGQFSATGAAGMPYSSANPKQQTTSWKAGIGLAYDISETLAMRVEAERFRIGDAAGHRGRFDMLSVGLVYRFGGGGPPPRQFALVESAAPVPIPVVPATAHDCKGGEPTRALVECLQPDRTPSPRSNP